MAFFDGNVPVFGTSPSLGSSYTVVNLQSVSVTQNGCALQIGKAAGNAGVVAGAGREDFALRRKSNGIPKVFAIFASIEQP